ncbi:MAG: alpha/beta fold hydrolase [Chloroflexota bacterium]
MNLELLTHKSENKTHPTPILFVHGAWHAAWCWEEHFLPYFASQGWDCYALSLRGHGGSEGHIRWASGADYVSDVAQIVEKIGTNPILVGHSMGGYVVQKYLENHAAPVGVLLASIPARGILPFTLRMTARHPLRMLQTMIFLDPYPLVGTIELMEEAFFSPGLPREKMEHYFHLIQTESFRIILDSLLLNLPHPNRLKTPLLVLGAANDRVFTVAEQHATARAYGTQAEFFPNMAHDMMLEPGWLAVADRVTAWLTERGL